MTGLHEALDDIAAEITPTDPPVGLAMRLGHKKRHRRRIAAITGTAGAMALSVAAVFGIPALTGPASTPTLTLGAARGPESRWRGRSCLSRHRAARGSTGTPTR
jgi:hypothetical protein